MVALFYGVAFMNDKYLNICNIASPPNSNSFNLNSPDVKSPQSPLQMENLDLKDEQTQNDFITRSEFELLTTQLKNNNVEIKQRDEEIAKKDV